MPNDRDIVADPADAIAATPRDQRTTQVRPEPYVVGIGASAGGLGALRTLFSRMPGDSGLACVVVVHLSPEHESHLVELLQPYTPMLVQQVTETVALEPNRVYVIPPNANLNAIDTHLRLSKLEERRIERAPIDHFLRTLATTHDSAAVGVILTGAGSDGALGLRQIKERGGLAIAQDPEEAEYDSMPRSAIATGMVDLVLPLREIPDGILRFCATRPRLPVPDGDDAIDALDEAIFEQILGELRQGTGHEFARYKRATVLKRIGRRMQLRHVDTLPAYLALLRTTPAEARALGDDLLVAVAEFFRESEVFDELEQTVLPQLFDRKGGAADRLRVWSVGCSTGEEAYSLAMLMLEQAADREPRPQLQVFASDLSDDMLGRAREGVYPQEVASTVSAERLERFFVEHGGHYVVSREVRDTVVFAAHDIFKDPPYAHLDLIVCRNLLRDLQPDVRRSVLALFHYALEPHGLLIVGPQDDIEEPGLFRCEPDTSRVCRRTSGPTQPLLLPASLHPFGRGAVPGLRRGAGVDDTADIATVHWRALEPYAPASVLINERDEIVHYSPRAGSYMRVPGGELTYDAFRLLWRPLALRLGQLLDKARREKRGSTSRSIAVSTESGERRVVLRVEPLAPQDPRGLMLVVIDELDYVAERAALHERFAKDRPSLGIAMSRLEADLARAYQQLRMLLEKQRGDSEEVAATNEQLHTANTELRLILEELESSKEELQAVNEELCTLDRENRHRLVELTQISGDMQHLLESTGIATLFLDSELSIVRFTPQLGELFNIRQTDVGRPLADLKHALDYAELHEDALRVLEHLVHVDREVESADGRWYVVRMLPYRAATKVVEGVVITLIDNTQRRRAEEKLRESDRRKDEFLSLLAHELRNPLAPISSGVEVLKAAGNDPRIVEQVAATMARQTRQLVHLVDDLLEVSRVSGGRLRLRKSHVALADVIRDAVESVGPLIERSGQEFTLSVTKEPIVLDADGARLAQVLANLLNNAVKFTPKEGRVSLSAEREGDEAVITVRDNGIGIPEDVLSHVFEMFYQGKDPRAKLNAGLGIGLTLAKSLVEMHGGRISATSAGVDRGSEFKVRLPISRVDTLPAPRVGKRGEEISGHRVLIIDDNADAAQTLSLVIQSLGRNEVQTASSGAEGLQKAGELKPDIMLLDLKMPEMDGYEVARRVRLEPWGADVLLVALTGYGQREHKLRTQACGFDRHLTKPADRAALETVLSEPRAAQGFV